ncbi:MAG: penicillin-binding protein 2 [Patescibacteria group bacterium]
MKRQTIVLGSFWLIFLFINLRLFYWQVIKSSTLAQAAADQYYYTLHLTPQRGNIETNDGAVLVTNKMAYLVYAEPPKIKNKNDFSHAVSELLTLEEEVVATRIASTSAMWVPLKRKVDEATRKKVEDLDLSGIGFEKTGTRFYPESSMAAHLLGFVGSDAQGQDYGYFGLEGHYQRALAGRDGLLMQEKDARGLPILLGSAKRISAENGQNLKLHLDRTVQFIAENKLKEGITRYGAKAGLVAIIEPKTGGILGAAAFPNYDPMKYGEVDNSLYANPLIAQTYEPGSTFKALIMAAALNEHVITPQTTFNEEGPVNIGQYFIRTWNNEYHGEMTMSEVLEKSSNPGMVFVAGKLGNEKLIKYIEDFGFGKKTGIDLEEEETSPLRPAGSWKEIDLATASFGQGIAVTPIQMLRAISVLANNGKLIEPHIVDQIIDPVGKTISVKPKVLKQVIRPATAKIITEMMISAVDKGEAKWAKPAGYRIAGKTGTAQIPVSGHYDSEKTIAAFVGFAPADDPKFAMLVLLREPTTSPWGSETAAPLFFNIAKELFTYYGISPN